ncbi:ATPase domain-containing protein [Halobellus marinus]|uniref:ATPase domain-containing protein n=1 Tax=Halobellus TaxID=1073986 RepID=UPI0028AD6573|nr:ATPase domain-containing protein [Halobellus sp. DFY28]
MGTNGSEHPAAERLTTGVAGLDEVLNGGLRPRSATLVRGAPGSGKTIIGLHFLASGVEAGETGLYVNLGEPSTYIRDTARAFGLDIDPVEFLTLSPSGEEFQTETTYDLFSSAEVEGPSLVDEIREEVEAIDPDRVVVDPATEFRYLTTDEHQFRTQILSLLDFLKAEGATVLLTSQAAQSMPDDELQFLVDAVLNVAEGADRRTISVSKFRGSAARTGQHTLAITEEGMSVWPRLDPGRYRVNGPRPTLSSGIPELDQLLSGGLTTGTVTLFSGPTGVGKTTTALQFLQEAAGRGQRSVLYSFEENTRTLLDRAEAVNIPVAELIERGTLRVEELGTEGLTVDEFTARIRMEVEERDAEVIAIDGTTGFEQSLVGFDGAPMEHLVDIGQYLRNANVTGLITNEVHQITGSFQATEQRISHLADSIVILRHVEYKGKLRKVIGVLKMRTSDYEPRLRELEITEKGLHVGEPLTDLRGILTGTPEWDDATD